ncbi:MAG TPA: hypothetical protein VL172_03585 [Kofleriaceae bacterium]|nr:hypothetical protein [Kofleriaceae bacterium]
MRAWICLLLAAGCSSSGGWYDDARVFVQGVGVLDTDCRTQICQHNENTDLVLWNDAMWLVHRTAESQVLGPNSALHVYRSDDGGATFTETALIPAPTDRDLRDPHFYIVGGDLHIKALTRLPVLSARDSDVDTISVDTHTSDGSAWTDLAPIGPPTWSFWRVREQDGVYYTAAYEDGDLSVKLFTSTDGTTWSEGPYIYQVAEDTPLETELTFMPSRRLLALVRMDGTDDELIGNGPRLRTKICWAEPPYDVFDCPQEFGDQRLDGPLTFFWNDRLFVVARKHLADGNRKRTSLFEITGDFDGGGELAIVEHGELPSAGDTAYAGAAPSGDRMIVSWYSSDIAADEPWARAMVQASDIWLASLDLSAL